MSFLLSRPGKSACHFMFDCSSKSGSTLRGVREGCVVVVVVGAFFVQPQRDANTPLTPRWQGGRRKLDPRTSNYSRPTGKGNYASVWPRRKRNQRYPAVAAVQLMSLQSEKKGGARNRPKKKPQKTDLSGKKRKGAEEDGVLGRSYVEVHG